MEYLYGTLAALSGIFVQWLLSRISQNQTLHQSRAEAINSVIYHTYQIWLVFHHLLRIEHQFEKANAGMPVEKYKRNLPASVYEAIAYENISNLPDIKTEDFSKIKDSLAELASLSPGYAIEVNRALENLVHIKKAYKALHQGIEAIRKGEAADPAKFEVLKKTASVWITENHLENLERVLTGILKMTDKKNRRHILTLIKNEKSIDPKKQMNSTLKMLARVGESLQDWEERSPGTRQK